MPANYLNAVAFIVVLTIIVFGAIVALLNLRTHPTVSVMAVIMIAVALLGFWRSYGFLKNEERVKGYIGREVTLEGRVVSVQNPEESKTPEEIEWYSAELDVYKMSGRNIRPFRVVLTVRNTEVFPNLYDIAVFNVALNDIENGLYDNSYRDSLRSQSVFVTGLGSYLRTKETASGVYSVLKYCKEYLNEAFLDFRHSEFIKALVIGDRKNLTSDIKQNFSDAGVSHILALSGLHISIILASLSMLFDFLNVHKRVYFFFALILLLFYMVITGFSKSVTRAGIMTLFTLSGVFPYRRTDGLNALCITLLVMIAWEPYSVGNVSLQLSFLSTLSIVVLSAPVMRNIDKSVNRFIFKRRLGRIYRFLIGVAVSVTSSVIITLGVLIFTFPTIVTKYDGINIVSFISNIVVIPQITFVIGFALVYLLMYIIPFLRFAAQGIMLPAVDFHSGVLLKSVEIFGDVPIENIWIVPEWRVVSAIIVLTAVLFLVLMNARLRYYAIPGVIVLLICAASIVITELNDKYEIHCLRYGSSRAVVFSHAGETVIYKAQDDDAYAAMQFCARYNVNSISAVIVPVFSDNYKQYFDAIYADYNIEKVFLCQAYLYSGNLEKAKRYFESHGTKVAEYEYFTQTDAGILDFEVELRNYKSYRLSTCINGASFLYATNISASPTYTPIELDGTDIVVLDGEYETIKADYAMDAEYFLFDFTQYSEYFKSVMKDKNIYDLSAADVHIFRFDDEKISMRSIS